MKYDSWEDMVDAQAIAFSLLCAQNKRLSELVDKADNGYNRMNVAEQNELFFMLEDTYNSPFFSRRCMMEAEEMEEQEHPFIPEEIPNSWDPLEQESYADRHGKWWE